MKNIQGLIIQHLGFDPQKMGDFIYYEGPLLSHFVDRQKPEDHYLYRWVDNNDDAHRWLIAKCTEKELLGFLNGAMSLKQLLQINPFVTLLDLDDDLNKLQVLITPIQNLPNNYFPTDNSFFKENLYQPYATQVRQTLLQKQQEQNTLLKLIERVAAVESQQHKTYNLLTHLLNQPLPKAV